MIIHYKMPKKKIYCGIGLVPKDSKLGNMVECVESNQVRYYGIKKIDPKLLEKGRKKKGPENWKRDKLVLEIKLLELKMLKIKKNYKKEKDKEKKKEMNITYKKMIEKKRFWVSIFNKKFKND